MHKRMLSILLTLLLMALCACTPEQAVLAPEVAPTVEAESELTPEQPSEPEPVEAEVEEPTPEPLKLDVSQADLGIEAGSYALRNYRGQYLYQESGILGLRDTPYLWYFDNRGDGSFLIKDAESRTVMLDIYNAWYDPGNRVTAYS